MNRRNFWTVCRWFEVVADRWLKAAAMAPLGIWLMVVGLLRLSSVWFGFFDIWALRLAVFPESMILSPLLYFISFLCLSGWQELIAFVTLGLPGHLEVDQFVILWNASDIFFAKISFFSRPFTSTFVPQFLGIFWQTWVLRQDCSQRLFTFCLSDFLAAAFCDVGCETVTDIHGRTFGTWTLLTCTLCFMTATTLQKNKPLYITTFLSFVYALAHFLSEAFIYKSMPLRGLATTGFFAGRQHNYSFMWELALCDPVAVMMSL
jgi:hypothetical protein